MKNQKKSIQDLENIENKDTKTKKVKKKNPNNQIMKITYLFLILFICMICYYVKFQVKDSDEAINNSYNKRQDVLAKKIQRGKIFSDDKQILAQTIPGDDDDEETRNYPFGNIFAHSVGYTTKEHGRAGVESIANYKLLTSNAPILEIAENEFKGEKNIGNDVITSLNVNLTKAAYNALGDNQGAIIAIDPTTGKILAMVSKPDFDPNTIDSIWDQLVSDNSNSNLLNRATNGLYTPGSTFKFFTLLEYIRENPDYDNYAYNCKGSITMENATIKCASGKHHGQENLLTSFANSCNSSFVNLGVTLDKNKFQTLCNELLFNTDLPLNFPYKKSMFVLNESSTTFDTMQTVMGQGKTLITPIHLAMIASAVANDGVLMKPYMVTEVQNYAGKTIKKYSDEKYKTILSKQEVDTVKEFLRAVITKGTGQRLNVEGYTAYGKTGTAQINDGSQSNSLFMGYAEKDGKKLAICVVMEDQEEGHIPAVPAAKSVFDVYFNQSTEQNTDQDAE